MSNEYFDKEKQGYENIEIPEDLDFLVRKTLKEGRRKKNHKNINKWSTAVAGVVLTFILLVNLFPKVAYAASLIPGLERLVKLVTWDKGFDNAINEGLTQEINFKETQNGITLRVDGLAGDWKKLWVNYSVYDGKDNTKFSNGRPKYSVDIKVILPKEYEEKGCYYGTGGLGDNGESVLDIGFPQFIDNFILEFKVYGNSGEDIKIGDERPEGNYLATFEIPIKLDPTIFNSTLNDVTIDNNLIQTSVGDIVVSSLESSKTRILMTFNLESSIYDFMGFENPRLVDNKGNVYTVSGSYISKDSEGNNCIEFAGEIKEGIKSLRFEDGVKTLRFECDGVYYAKNNNRDIVVNLKDGYVKPNDYGIKYGSDIRNGSADIDIITLSCDGARGITFDRVYDNNGKEIIEDAGIGFYGDEESGYSSNCYLKILDKDLEEVTLKLFWILKDRTEPVSAELIKLE